MNIKYLRVVFFRLDTTKKVEDIPGLNEDELALFKKEYLEHDANGIVEAVRWAAVHPEYDFLALSPELSPRFSNIEVHGFLVRMAKSFEKYP